MTDEPKGNYILRMRYNRWYINFGGTQLGPMPWAEAKEYCKVLESQGYTKES